MDKGGTSTKGTIDLEITKEVDVDTSTATTTSIIEVTNEMTITIGMEGGESVDEIGPVIYHQEVSAPVGDGTSMNLGITRQRRKSRISAIEKGSRRLGTEQKAQP